MNYFKTDIGLAKTLKKIKPPRRNTDAHLCADSKSSKITHHTQI